MNAEQFIEENYFGLKIDCQRDIQTIYQALEDYARALQLLQANVVGRSEQFYCNQDDGEYNNNPCSEQCRFCKDGESLQ